MESAKRKANKLSFYGETRYGGKIILRGDEVVGTIKVLEQPEDANPNSEKIFEGFKVEMRSGSAQFFYLDQCGGNRRQTLRKAKAWAQSFYSMLDNLSWGGCYLNDPNSPSQKRND